MEEKRVWFADEKEGWSLGTVRRTDGKFLQVEAPSGQVG
jgi:hypothetical protein